MTIFPSTRARGHRPADDEYLNLVRAFPLRPLRSADQHTEALHVLTRLLGRPDGKLSLAERDYADLLGRLLDDYHRTTRPLPRRKFSPLQMLRYLMDQNGMSAAALGKLLGNKTSASLVLNGKRQLSKSHIRLLAERFKVDGGLFL